MPLTVTASLPILLLTPMVAPVALRVPSYTLLTAPAESVAPSCVMDKFPFDASCSLKLGLALLVKLLTVTA